MTLTCDWHFDDLPPCSLNVASALTHFALAAYTWLGFYLQETDVAQDIQTWNMATPPVSLPERELTVYAGPYFALLLPSELLTIILTYIDAWQANHEQIIMAWCLTEGNT